MAKVFVVHNPVAGTHSPEAVRTKMQNFFNEKNWEYNIHTTSKGENTPKLISDKIQNDYDLIIASGGDGTISAVASGIFDKDIPLGILPTGTGNGLASDLNIPLDLDQALALIYSKPAVRSVDAFIVRDRYYLLNLSVGFTSLAIKNAKREEKRKFGLLAYFLAGLRSLIGIQPNNFNISIDSKDYRIKASEVILMNSVTLGDTGRFLNLGIKNDDGKLDLFIIKSKSIFDYLKLVVNFIFWRPKQDPNVERYYVQDELIINAIKYSEVQADGELLGYLPVEIKIAPNAVNIIVPGEL